MKKLTWFSAIIVIFALTAQLSAAPLFPDVKANHWAADAVAQLAAKGIVEGYPDGTFKGDRAATRWETALIIARLLAKDERMWVTFATKEDLESLKQLINQFKDELDAMGVRVNKTEDNIIKVTKRIKDIEKITFYGSVDSLILSQNFRSALPGGSDPWGYADNSIYNVTNAIGSQIGPCIRPNGMAVLLAAAPPTGVYSAFPVVDFRNTRPLTNGSAFTTAAVLGANIKVSDDVDAKAEFAAYTRYGSAIVAPYGGVTPSYLSNIFTSDTALTGLTNLNTSWTKVTLDNLVLNYKKSKVKVQLGSFLTTDFDPEVLYGETNPNTISGPGKLPFFGMRVTGKTNFLAPMRFEFLGSKMPNGQPGGNLANGTVYNTMLSGFTLGWEIKGGDIKLNFVRIADDYFGGTALAPGGMENPFAWQNPSDYYAAAVPTQAQRPIQAGDGANGLMGPQAETIWGASVRYELPNNIKIEGLYCGSQYKPNINSAYSVNGHAGRVKLSTAVLKKSLDLSAEYMGVGAFYDPFVNVYPGVVNLGTVYGGAANLTQVPEPFYRIGLFSTGFYQLHENTSMTNNRAGIRLAATYRLPKNEGSIFGRYINLEQVAYAATMANGGISNKPGFVEGFFSGLQGGETKKGRYECLLLGTDYKFSNKLYTKISYTHHRFMRPTDLTNAFAANNNINIVKGVGSILLNYPVNDKLLLKGGYDLSFYRGAYRVTGLPNWDYNQKIPYIGFDYKINENTVWSMLAEQIYTGDNVSPTVVASGGSWGWRGNRIYSEFKVNF